MGGPEQKRERVLVIEVVGLEVFRETIKGWRTVSDGDFCGDCWGVYLQQFDQKLQTQLKEEARPTKDYAKHRRISDGWYVECERCQKTVSAKDPEHK